MASNPSVMKERIPQLDYLKGIFILLMVTFHLSLTEQTYPVLYKAVYTFHMSAFLVISGYLANVDKRPAEFARSVLRLALPYVLFESLYILMEYFFGGSLGAHNAIGQLTCTDFVMRIATMPSGPYWYLHTLAIGMTVYWLIYRVFRLQGIGGLAVMGLILYGCSLVIEGLDWSNVIFFLIGVFIMRLGKSILEVITPSWLALLPLVVLFWFPANYERGSLAGIAITVLVISLLLAVYPHCLKAARNMLCHVGRNSLAIVVFSPIFTVLTKQVSPLFDFDPSAVCFTIASLALVVAGCLGCAWLSDRLALSRWIFFKKDFYSSYSHVA